MGKPLSCLWCLPLLFTLPTEGNCWNLEEFVQTVCNKLGEKGGTHCTCVDLKNIPDEGKNLCGNDLPLGSGIYSDEPVFEGWSEGRLPQPNIGVYQTTCDARNSKQGANTNCLKTVTSTKTVTTTTSLTASLGAETKVGGADLGVGLKGTFTVAGSTYLSTTTNITAGGNCGPADVGQPAGTCNTYSQEYYQYNLYGAFGFKFSAIVHGGVQMSFDDPIDVPEIAEMYSGKGTHYYWWLPIASIVRFAQSNSVANSQLFNAATLQDDSVKFNGAGFVTDQLLAYSTCTIHACNN